MDPAGCLYLPSRLARAVSMMCLVMTVVLIAGCAGENHLREAQAAFNQGAEAENALRLESMQPLEGNASAVPAAWSVARNGYASALVSLEKISGTDEQRLRADGLWATALTLKALSQWRLGQFSKALATAETADKNAGDQIYPRDRALLAALPGLIKTDQAYNKIIGTNSEKNLSEVEALLVGDNGAVANIQHARELADRQHPVQVYLIQAQLAAYRNFMVAHDRLNNHATIAVENPNRQKANAHLKELDAFLKGQQDSADRTELVNYWATLCALDVP